MTSFIEPAGEIRRGELDLVGLFEVEALNMLQAVKRGRILHNTKNIRDSGTPLEAAFREFLSKKLPSQFKALQGYLFDVDSHCTPQIDAMIVDASECHEFLTLDAGSSYVPFTSGLIIFEIKNSTGALTKTLEQVKKTIVSVNDMWQRPGSDNDHSVDVLSVLFFAQTENSTPGEIHSWFSGNSAERIRNLPKYIVLLDKGLIITRRSIIHDFSGENPKSPLKFDEYVSPGELCVFAPAKHDEFRSGRTLLWFYFALISFLTRFEGGKRRISAFTDKFVDEHAMQMLTPLATLSKWSDLDSLINPGTTATSSAST